MILFALDPLLLTLSLACHVAGIRWAIRTRARRPKLVGALTAIYLGGYIALSVNGSYVLANHGGQDYSRSWAPSHLIEQFRTVRVHIRPTPLAAVYLPLNILDRLVVHPALEPWDGYYDAIFGSYRARPVLRDATGLGSKRQAHAPI